MIIKPHRGVQLNRSHPLARGLTGAWLFNEGTGNIAYDLANQRIGDLVSTAWEKGGLSFDTGGNSRLTVRSPGDGIFNALEAFSVFQTCSTISTKGYQALFSTAFLTGFFAQFAADEKPYLKLGATQTRYWDPISNFRDGNKHSFCVTVPGAGISDVLEAQLYYDGAIQEPSTTASTDAQSAKTFFQVGYAGHIISPFGGYIYCTFVYNRAITPDEARALSEDPYQMFRRPSRARYFFVPSGPVVISAEVSDGLIASEVLAKIANLQAAAVDGFSSADAGSKIAQFVSASVDGAEIGEIAERVASFSSTLYDGFLGSDLPEAYVGIFISAADGFSLSDQSSKISTMQGASVDGCEFSDSLSVASFLVAAAIDGVSISELLSSGLSVTLLGEISDGLKVSDSLSQGWQFLTNVSDVLKLSESLSRIAQLISAGADGIAWSDSAAGSRRLPVSVSDSGAFSDLASLFAGFGASVSEGFLIGDLAGINAQFNVVAADGLMFADAVAKIMQFAVMLTESLKLGDVAFHVAANGVITISFSVNRSTLIFNVSKSKITFN